MGCLLGFLSYIIALVVYFNGLKQFNDPEQVDISVSSGFIVGMFAYLFITLVVLHEYYMVKLCKRNRENH
ncbi:hypothetical protein PNOK_0222200 [Pyrrhoderma noxium]|uniref:Uncharacterized protein n=1 Tax=Pyrrhoderma noxium TaxID=2282107 RepID=A0A286US20_9AGAM|nr:hypothetical protein PNOK_0222200 [Pyrrhoderma noxium]